MKWNVFSLFLFFWEVPSKKKRRYYTSEKSHGGRHKKEHARKTSRKPNRSSTYILERADIEYRVITINNNHPKKIHPPKRLSIFVLKNYKERIAFRRRKTNAPHSIGKGCRYKQMETFAIGQVIMMSFKHELAIYVKIVDVRYRGFRPIWCHLVIKSRSCVAY